MFARPAWLAAIVLAGCAATPAPQPTTGSAVTPAQWAAACPADAGWDDPGPPFRIHGNAWYVGTCGIAAVLITGEAGHVLIDSGTEKGAEVVAANVRRLGFRLEDVKMLLMTHEHHDHVGGMARLQQLTGAPLVTSAAATPVLRNGRSSEDDPQVGVIDDFPPVANVRELTDDDKVAVGALALQAIRTPGHTPGALSWQWRSCDGSDCRIIVYADSLSAISNDAYRFSDRPEYVAAFHEGLDRLAAAECDILLTPHPVASAMNTRAATGLAPDPSGCARFATEKRKQLDARLAKEATAQ